MADRWARKLDRTPQIRVERIELPPVGQPWDEKFVTKNEGWKAGQEVNLIVKGVVKTLSHDKAHADVVVTKVSQMA